MEQGKARRCGIIDATLNPLAGLDLEIDQAPPSLRTYQSFKCSQGMFEELQRKEGLTFWILRSQMCGNALHALLTTIITINAAG